MFKISEDIFCGPRVHPRKLMRAGFKSAISLQRGWFDLFHGTGNHSDYSMGIEIRALPLSDIWPPKPAEVISFFEMLEYLPKPIYFHCLHGKDRTGMLRAVYRIVEQSWSLAAALNEMDNQGFHNAPYFFWKWKLGELALAVFENRAKSAKLI